MNIEEIKPYWRNPRKNDDTIEPLKESIKKFGYQSPIIVDANNVIVVGHARFKALLQLKGTLDTELSNLEQELNQAKGKEKERISALINNLKQVNAGKIEVIVAENLTEKQAKEYRIADNKLTDISEWDFKKLPFEIRELGSVIGFTGEEINDMFSIDEIKGVEQYDSEDFENAKKSEAEKYVEASKKHEEDKVRIVCPYCKEEFWVNKQDIISDEKYKY